MQFLGLDIGSSSIKGAILDLERACVLQTERVSFPDPLPGLPSGHFEIDPRPVVDAVQSVIAKLLAQSEECTGIVSCTQMAGMVLVDRDANPLSNYLSWRDQRVLTPHPSEPGSYYDNVKRLVAAEGLTQLGHECKLGSSPSLAYWLKVNGQLPDHATPVMLADFVGMQLAGADAVTEFTNALGAINLADNSWHLSAMERLGLEGLNWPHLCSPHSAVGCLAYDGRQIPWFPSVGDHQCALVGTLLQHNELSLNISTGSQASVLTSEFRAGEFQVRPYFDCQFLATITHLPAGRSLNAIVNLLLELSGDTRASRQDPWAYIHEAAESVNLELDVDLAFFSGPMGERGSIGNICLDSLSVGSLFRGAFRNMAENFAKCARRLGQAGNWNSAVLSGGVVQQSKLLQAMIAEKLDCPIRNITSTEETFIGMLVLAFVASGQAGSVQAATALLGKRSTEVI